MLASLLNSPLAIEVSLFVVRTFVKLRNLMVFYKDLASKIDKLEYKYDKQLEAHEENLRDIVEVLRTLMAQPQEPPHRSIGFKANTEE